MSLSREFFAGILSAVLIFTASAAAANEANSALASRLNALLGQEREAIAVVPDARLSSLTTAPVAKEGDTETTPISVSYSRDFLNAQPVPAGGPEWRCLSEALYFEARGESAAGMFAVGEVILNRVDSASYPDSICAVVHQGTGRKFACQFTWTCDNHSDVIRNQAAFDQVGKVAKLLIDGAPRALTDGATHYHTLAVSPSWARRFPRTARIGQHLFYREPTRSASN